MRTIKFRCWNGQRYLNEDYFYVLRGKPWESTDFSGEKELKNCVLEQYVGLSDKNGKKIFEGDILKVPRNYYLGGKQQFYTGFVHYYGTEYSVNMGDKERDWSLWHILDDGGLVIGNIHENPNLLTDSTVN